MATLDKAQELTRDDELGQRLESEIHEAAERATFHRVEAERWERVGRAAGAGLRELRLFSPVLAVSATDLLDGPQDVPATSVQAYSREGSNFARSEPG